MNKVFIIAEAGVNHNGNLDTAKQLVDVAKGAGADAVKFQTFKAEELVSHNAEKAEYQKSTTSSNETQLNMIRRLELNREAHFELVRYCAARGIEFLSTAFDLKSVGLLQELDLRIWKIPSGEIINLPYLRRIGAMRKKIILSTGMATMGEVEAAICALESAGTIREQITLLHCTTEYPAPLNDVNLLAMVTLGKTFGLEYGYSDHTSGIAISIAAAALGASVIEKHFTLDRNMEGPDHKASLEPTELATLVSSIRSVELSLGNGIKRLMPSEIKNKSVARKSVVASREIDSGEIFSEQNLTVKRPGNGISPMEWDRIIGRVARRSYHKDEMIQW